ncbi:ABC transporter permease [Marinomonas sp. 5E14-1]|uniref:ABC transporter permease n=1 Tax=Marinomonas sp. 5E14-1 TaxID=3153922 RepID=UPI003267A74A
MWRYVSKRIMQGMVVLFIVSFFGFIIFQFLGDPAIAMAGQYATQAEIEAIRVSLGLDRSIYIQYFNFITNALQGNFGISYVTRLPALELVLQRLPATIELAIAAQVIAIVFGVLLGVLVAAFPRALLSKFSVVGSLFGISLPTFAVGILLILFFAVEFPIFPPFGRGELITLPWGWETGFLTWDGLKHLVLPALTLGLLQLALLFRLTRSGMQEALRSNYIRTARAKGLSRFPILFKHALRNVMIPVITIIGLQFGQLVGFSIVTEKIFQWPGTGNLLLSAIFDNDFPIVSTYIILIATLIVILNTLVDITYAFLNPRIRYD